ncbi:hypothetical protein NQ317_011830 [Molorchus minor]|uniref:Uncharacterized protein n=1 Tax=Molorchus minor TaxID=1323400 RepID=A0ABQ9JF74_9CUCU|nr:hypothetical protein NQ317_011830 [Molorchus minor]
MLSCINRFRQFSSSRRSFTVGKIIYNKPANAINSSSTIPEVSGLSEACVKVPSQPVGPGAAKNTGYKNPEYFCYNQMSYYEAEVEIISGSSSHFDNLLDNDNMTTTTEHTTTIDN